MSCILCYVQADVSVCRKCLVPWLPAYADTIESSRPEFIDRAIREPGVVCLECVRSGEYGLDVKDTMTEHHKEQLSRIHLHLGEEAPPLEFVQVRIR